MWRVNMEARECACEVEFVRVCFGNDIYARSLNGIHLPRFTREDWSVTAVDSTAERDEIE
jgi:hypothetical protein